MLRPTSALSLARRSLLATRIDALLCFFSRGYGSTLPFGDLHKSTMAACVPESTQPKAPVHSTMYTFYTKRPLFPPPKQAPPFKLPATSRPDQKKQTTARCLSLRRNLMNGLETLKPSHLEVSILQCETGTVHPRALHSVMDTKLRAMMRRPRLGRRADVSRLSL